MLHATWLDGNCQGRTRDTGLSPGTHCDLHFHLLSDFASLSRNRARIVSLLRLFTGPEAPSTGGYPSLGQLGCIRCHCVGAREMSVSSSAASRCVPAATSWRNRPRRGSARGGGA